MVNKNLVKDQAVVIKIFPYRETSLIVHCFTHNHGLIHTIAKGIYRTRSNIKLHLDLFFLIELIFYMSHKTELATLHEAILIDSFPQIRRNFIYMQSISWITKLIEKSIEPYNPVPELFSYLKTMLYNINQHKFSPHLILMFEITLLKILGLLPNTISMDLNLNLYLSNEDLNFEFIEYIGKLLSMHLGIDPAERQKLYKSFSFK